MKPETKATCDAIEAIKLPVRYSKAREVIVDADDRSFAVVTRHPFEMVAEQIVTALNQYQAVCAENTNLSQLLLTAIAELQRLYNRHGELYTKETIDEIMQKAALAQGGIDD